MCMFLCCPLIEIWSVWNPILPLLEICLKYFFRARFRSNLMAWVGLKIFCLQNMMGCEQGITGKLTSTFFLMWQILQEIRSWTNMLYLKLGEMVNMARAEQLFYSLFYIYNLKNYFKNGSINLIQFKPC